MHHECTKKKGYESEDGTMSKKRMRRNTREMRKEGEKRRGSEEWKTEKEGMEVNTEV